MTTHLSFTDLDQLELGWVPNETYMIQREFSNAPAIYDTILGYDADGYVVVVRKQRGNPSRIVTHLTAVNDRKPVATKPENPKAYEVTNEGWVPTELPE